MPTMVEVAIGMILVFLVASAAASAINEFVEGALKRRPKYLRAALNRATSTELAQELYDTKWITTLRTPIGRVKRHLDENALAGDGAPRDEIQPERKDPAYIPSDIFAAAVRELLEQGAIEPLKGIDDDDVEKALGMLPKDLRDKIPDDIASVPRIRRFLQDLANNGEFWTEAQKRIVDAFPPHVLDDLDREARNVQRWYEATMDRMSGWYKRRTKWWLILWGALLAVTFNVDSMSITETLWSDETVRAAAVAAAEDYINQDDPTCTVNTDEGDDPFKCVDAALDQLRDVETFGVPLGWPWPWDWGHTVTTSEGIDISVAQNDPRVPDDFGEWVLKVLGLAGTAFAVSFGAPVWFDLLNKVVNFRASGVKPEPGGTSGALDQPAFVTPSARSDDPSSE